MLKTLFNRKNPIAVLGATGFSIELVSYFIY
ncbi:hypothetical protein OE09_1703 [Flavobacteriaceae bacterium MAR_2010_72]|nr:hypothetical protein OE09_1703 [Flavobacteriaceae bacterium MAR_2010_72]